MAFVLSTRLSWTLSPSHRHNTHLSDTLLCKDGHFYLRQSLPIFAPLPQSYHICTRTLIPSISSVFILKSIPVKEEIRLGHHVTVGARKWAAFALSTPGMTNADLDTVSFAGPHPPAQPLYPGVIAPLAAQANDLQLRPCWWGNPAEQHRGIHPSVVTLKRRWILDKVCGSVFYRHSCCPLLLFLAGIYFW